MEKETIQIVTNNEMIIIVIIIISRHSQIDFFIHHVMVGGGANLRDQSILLFYTVQKIEVLHWAIVRTMSCCQPFFTHTPMPTYTAAQAYLHC